MNTLELQIKANEIRRTIISMLTLAGSGHSAGPLGLADVLATLYFKILNEGDQVILSCGHYAPLMYAVFHAKGLLTDEELKTLRKLGSKLQGHPDRRFLPEITTTSGPLGSGLAQATGIALATRMDKKNARIFCICSDGEHDEGNHWEAVNFAAKYKLPNLTVFVDRNRIQIDGPTEKVMPLESLGEKYRSFNWGVVYIDGNNIEEIISGVSKARAIYDRPTAIIAATTPGKGVSFMENKFEWHGKAPNIEESKIALQEIDEVLKSFKEKIKEEE